MDNAIQFYIPISGITNKHQVLELQQQLEKIKEVQQAMVTLNHQKILITALPSIPLMPLIHLIENLGYQVSIAKETIPVLNMSCASCASSVSNVLNNQLGVLQADVNFATANVQLQYINDITNTSVLKSALENVGFDLLLQKNDEAQEELATLKKQRYKILQLKTFWSIIFAFPLMVIGMFFMDMPYANYIMWILSTPVIWLGRGFYKNAFLQAKHLNANMDTLVAISTAIAYLFSIFNTLFPSYWHQKGMHAHVYFEAAAVVIAFILLGKLLEEKAKNNTSAALNKLIGLQPKTVNKQMTDGSIVEINIQDVLLNDIIVVKPGDKIAVDGILIQGSSYVDESMLTGEPIPVYKEMNTMVYAGTINQNGSFLCKATQIGSQTLLSQIIKSVQDAQGSKAPVQKMVDKIAEVFVPIVIGIAIITFIVWNVFGGENAFNYGLNTMITVLVIACPCALGLATPTAIMVGVGKAASNGILIKDAESLELAQKTTVVVLDKTGTITEGKPTVTDAMWLHQEEETTAILVAIEKLSSHPLANAIVKFLPTSEPLAIKNFENIAGMGASATLNQTNYYVGNLQLIQNHAIQIPQAINLTYQEWLKESKTVVWFANEKTVLAIFALNDVVKSTSKQAIKQLQKNGIEVHMLTGDHEQSALLVCKQVGIQHYKAGVLPHEKLAYIKQLQDKGNIVAMVGDGINDSSALAQANVSIAMGKGSDIAMDVAKMTIISSDLTKISTAINISKATVNTIQQNLFWAFIYNILGIPIAAGILFPINGFLLNPMIAGAAMAFSSVSVVSNSLRLKWK